MTGLPVVDLMKLMPDGTPAVASYTEFRRITGEKDSPEMFSTWLLVAATLMLPPGNRVPS